MKGKCHNAQIVFIAKICSTQGKCLRREYRYPLHANSSANPAWIKSSTNQHNEPNNGEN
jgi:hypothetical protein